LFLQYTQKGNLFFSIETNKSQRKLHTKLLSNILIVQL